MGYKVYAGLPSHEVTLDSGVHLGPGERLQLKSVGASNLFLPEQQDSSHVCGAIEWARSSEIKEISHEVLSRFHRTHSHTLRAC